MRNDNATTNEIINALRGVDDYEYIMFTIPKPLKYNDFQTSKNVMCDRRNVDVR